LADAGTPPRFSDRLSCAARLLAPANSINGLGNPPHKFGEPGAL
jgi:hypothetical protein